MKKYYDMYNGIKGGQLSYKDSDGDWVEPRSIEISNEIEKRLKAGVQFSDIVNKIISKAQDLHITDYDTASLFLTLKQAHEDYVSAIK